MQHSCFLGTILLLVCALLRNGNAGNRNQLLFSMQTNVSYEATVARILGIYNRSASCDGQHFASLLPEPGVGTQI